MKLLIAKICDVIDVQRLQQVISFPEIFHRRKISSKPEKIRY